jgi:hypothetical protein
LTDTGSVDAEALQHWYSVRLVVEIGLEADTDADFANRFEDRFILVRAKDEEEALMKATGFTEDGKEEYLNADGGIARRTFHMIEAQEILDSIPQDGTELYSAFVDSKLADALIKGGDSPVRAWLRQHPGADPGAATVGDVVKAWEDRDSLD